MAPGPPPNPPISDKDKENFIKIWGNIVDVQKHFNDIEIRIRNFAITIFTFIFAGIGYCIKENIFFYKFGISISFASLIALVGIILIIAIYIMDKHWYHRLLHASVEQGLEIEKTIVQFYPNMDLTTAIKSKSPSKIFFELFTFRSDGKLRLFYLILLIPFVVVFLGLLIFKTDLELNSEYYRIRNNASRVMPQSLSKLPSHPGLIIGLELNGQLYFVKQTDNIMSYITNYSKSDSLAFNQKKIFYAETRIGRSELEDLIRSNGIVLRE